MVGEFIQNEKTFPEIFYGLHFSPGIAEYREGDQPAYRILINENTAKQMDPTFAGKPIYVEHVDAVNLDNLKEEAAGYVVESFFNKADGFHWVKFIVVSDEAKQKIKSGWRLSNAYQPLQMSKGGLWHGAEYAKEITAAAYEHLAIVNNPRYEESMILTPEQFKKYNDEKEFELKKLANSKQGESKMGLNFFKRSKVENSLDIENTRVELLKSKKEVSIGEAITLADKFLNMSGYAHPDHMVKLHDDSEMSVGELVKKHQDMCNKLAEHENAKSDKGGEPGKGADDDHENDKSEGEKQEEELVDHDKLDRGMDKSVKDNDDDGDEEHKAAEVMMKKNAKEKALRLKNAHLSSTIEERISLPVDQVARGKKRYGSN